MHSPYHPQSSDSGRTSSAQDKAMLQRQYRAKEADALAQLRELLRGISQGADAHQTRLETIVQATEMIEYLYRRNTMLQELHELPRPEPGHGATAVFNSHLVQVQHPFAGWRWGNDHADERHQYSADTWHPPTMSGCPTSLYGVAMSGDRSLRH
ncbi:hypothetical protein DEU56DRAFT_913602 [Suillus clintonianus]|uniref:uncharacterized protein n=1 Tax=Suillus clintonianus TaxID=1904413 RepID=UPI001B86D4D4|nr:uncharacterized protein DEU56DRAFT_913602 [Suillus clintonianus]KAG2134824.1 hypothetical protein DEU56DRAFT_913602 [Suillus clintonianus]